LQDTELVERSLRRLMGPPRNLTFDQAWAIVNQSGGFGDVFRVDGSATVARCGVNVSETVTLSVTAFGADYWEGRPPRIEEFNR
jgi:hypothetical protein